MKKYDIAVVIGRFQPLHIAHEELIKSALQTAKHVLVLVGSANESRTNRNPLTFHERRNIIEIVFSKQLSQLTVRPLNDFESDLDWVLEIDSEVSGLAEHLGYSNICFVVCGKDTATKNSNSILNTLRHDIVYNPLLYNLSATSIRQCLSGGTPIDQIVTLPNASKKYLEKCWQNVSIEINKHSEPLKKKWYNRGPFNYFIDAVLWVSLLFLN